MKRSVAIKKLKDYLEAQDVLDDISEDVLNFIEKEIGMLPPKTLKEKLKHNIARDVDVEGIEERYVSTGTSYFLSEVNEWDAE